MGEEEDCNVWFHVDFGEGPVKVRCTSLAGHRGDHECRVIRPEDRTMDIPPVRHNIFEEDDDD